MSIGWTIGGVIIGAIIAMMLTILVENTRRPRLEMKIGKVADRQYQGRPAVRSRFLRFALHNRPLPRWARWMSRNAAMHCKGTITFHHLDGQDVFGRAMGIRWSDTTEPVPMYFDLGNQRIHIQNSTTVIRDIHVYPGDTVLFDVAARFDDDSECYGWSDASYSSSPTWRNPDWKLPKARYLVDVTIYSAGEKCTGVFRLINDVGRQDFRLEPRLKTDPMPR